METSKDKYFRNYRIQKKLGEGGMGSVYLAEDMDMNRNVALKVLHSGYKESSYIERFQREAKILTGLHHKNIVSFYSFFKEGEYYCIGMEYIEGNNLKDLVKKEGPLSEDRAIKIFLQILEGVGYIHDRGIIHRDIKPSNIMISRDGNVKVLDFGIAKLTGNNELTGTKTKIGTLYYMSPE